MRGGISFVITGLTLAFLFMASCMSDQPGLVSTVWMLEGPPEQGGLIQPEVTLEFEPDGEITGFYSHLNYKGLYRVDGEHLAIDDICWLSLVCQAETNMSGPQDYIEALMNAERYVIEGDTLIVHTGGDNLNFIAFS